VLADEYVGHVTGARQAAAKPLLLDAKPLLLHATMPSTKRTEHSDEEMQSTTRAMRSTRRASASAEDLKLLRAPEHEPKHSTAGALTQPPAMTNFNMFDEDGAGKFLILK
jgi:hypothetical protein